MDSNNSVIKENIIPYIAKPLSKSKSYFISYLFVYLSSDVISQEKTATSSRSFTEASKYAIPLKPTHKLAESKRYLVTW